MTRSHSNLSSVMFLDLEQCEPGWDKFHGFCYRHFSQRLSWEVAEQHCRMVGAHLVSIISPEEQAYINSRLRPSWFNPYDCVIYFLRTERCVVLSPPGNYKEYQWTGLNDKTIEDDFRWSDGNPLVRNTTIQKCDSVHKVQIHIIISKNKYSNIKERERNEKINQSQGLEEFCQTKNFPDESYRQYY